MKIKDLYIVKYGANNFYSYSDIIEKDGEFELSPTCESYNGFSERLLERAELNHEVEYDEWGNEIWYDKKEKILEFMNAEVESD